MSDMSYMSYSFKQKGVSLIELLIAGLILIVVSLFVSSIFMRGSINLVSSWDETVSLSKLQELAEEIKGAARDRQGPYSYIVMRAANPPATSTHYHINISTLVHDNTDVPFTVVAHTANNERDDTNNGGGANLTPMWELEEGSMGAPTLVGNPPQVILHKGIGEGRSLHFPGLATGTTRARGYLSFPNSPRKAIIVYPRAGEWIEEGDLKGTRTASFELFDDPLDGVYPADLLPGDYMKGTITFTYQRKSQTGTGTKNMVTIIAPFPE